MFVIPSVRLVAGCTTQAESRLMQVRLLELLSLVTVARQTGIHGIGLNEARGLAGMRIVAGDAFALRSGMLNFRLFNFLRLLAVAANAERLGIRFSSPSRSLP